jgi:thymidine phosphorylase
VAAARAVLAGGGDARLAEVTLRLGEEALLLRGWSRERAAERLRAALADGSALAAWERMVEAHGGDPDPDRLVRPARQVEVLTPAAGWLAAVDGEALGWVAVDLGAGRRTRDEPLDHGAGLVVHARIGDRLDAGQPVATLLVGRRPVDVAGLVARVAAAFRVEGEAVAPPPLVLPPLDALPA